MNKLAVLLVDDDPDYLELLSSVVASIPNVELTLAHSPNEAFELLKNHGYSLIISDWAINSTTAPEIFAAVDHSLKLRPFKAPVLFISSSEKVAETFLLHQLKNFEPVSFILKRCGPPMIGLMAQHILTHFHETA